MAGSENPKYGASAQIFLIYFPIRHFLCFLLHAQKKATKKSAPFGEQAARQKVKLKIRNSSPDVHRGTQTAEFFTPDLLPRLFASSPKGENLNIPLRSFAYFASSRVNNPCAANTDFLYLSINLLNLSYRYEYTIIQYTRQGKTDI